MLLFGLRFSLKRDKNNMVSQMARAKNLGEPFKKASRKFI